MTMVPAEIDKLSNLQQHQLLLLLQGGGGVFGGYAFDHHNIIMSRVHGYEYQSGATNCVGSDPASSNPMAEDESRTNSLNEAASTSKENNHCGAPSHQDDSWLQLGLGSQAAGRHDDHHSDPTTEPRRPGELIELDLLPGGGSSQLQARVPSSPLPLGSFFHVPEFRAPPRPVLHTFGPSLFFQHQLQQAGSSSTASFPYHQEVGWALRPLKGNMAAVGSSSSLPSAPSSSLMAPFGPCFARPFHVQGGMDVGGPSSEFRVVDPPRRPHSGVWFVLQASQNQVREPVLPQIPKSYLRIKDGRMTVRLLMKYLVNKLRLDSESEIEITCRGQQLQPFFTLQHVRDSIWSPSDALTLLPPSSTADHLMVLHYARSHS